MNGSRPDEWLEDDREDQVSAGAALVSYLRALRAHKALVAAVTLAAVLAAVGWLRLAGTSYEASASILVVPVPEFDTAFAGLPLIRAGGPDEGRVVQTAADLLDSPEAAQLAADRLGRGETPDAIENATEVQAESESNLVEVVGTAGSPTRAAELANAFARGALDARARELAPLVDRALAATDKALAQIEDPIGTAADELRARRSALAGIDEDPTLALIRPATPPTSPTGTPRAIVIGFALVAGLLLGAITAVLREVLTPRRLRDESDLARVFPLPVLARIPQPPRRRARRSRRRTVSAATAEGVRSLHARLELRADDRAGVRVNGPRRAGAVLITSPSRADRVSGVAVALARAASARGESAIVIDADLRAAPNGGGSEQGTSAGLRALLGDEPFEAVLADLPGIPNASILAGGDLRPEEADQLLARMPELIGEARLRADWVVVDAPPLGDEVDALAAAAVVDEVVIVVRPGRTAIAALSRLREALEIAAATAAGYVLVGGSPKALLGDRYPMVEPPPGDRERRSAPVV